VRSDVEAAAATSSSPQAPGAESTAGPLGVEGDAAKPEPGLTGPKGEVTLVDLSRVQRVIARRMAESKATVPDFTLVAEVDMERCVGLRRELKELAGGAVPSLNDMVVKACALALRDHPRANGSYRDGQFELYSRVNVGIAVASTDALHVPTVFEADRKSLAQIAGETRHLADRARAGRLTPAELAGGTFTVSNLGMFGVRRFTALVNPPQAAILAVGAIVQRTRAVDGQAVMRHVMDVTLACDHRILYGADAARFLARIRNLLEQPAALLVREP
jgi:pyruvate dehydrogenase E2 component (dihydrolipoyllysine-residue acetyltransferase)